jgi:hypothetical protein
MTEHLRRGKYDLQLLLFLQLLQIPAKGGCVSD